MDRSSGVTETDNIWDTRGQFWQRVVVRGLQRRVPARQSPLLLSADHHRLRQPVFAHTVMTVAGARNHHYLQLWRLVAW